ncbi:MAG: molybdate ABC transporter substrate-binding protein [Rhodospirillaceae bacterium]|nr:molybdate ABC transporter substrate-binding protein [Rhodospirillaceae bacterium]
MTFRARCAGRLIAAGLAVSVALALAVPASAADVLVFAAASLKNALDAAAAQYAKDSGKTIKASYAASPALAKQIENGAPADIFISADEDWMDYLAGTGLVEPDSRFDLLGNHLVLVAARDSAATATIAPDFPLADLLGNDGRLAMADPSSVPAGKYGRAALETLGVWSSVEGRLATAENVRAALALVSKGEAPIGIVYQTDAAADPGVKVIGVFPDDSHPPIRYPVALIKASTNPDAAAVLDYLKSPTAQAIFTRHGFVVLK